MAKKTRTKIFRFRVSTLALSLFILIIGISIGFAFSPGGSNVYTSKTALIDNITIKDLITGKDYKLTQTPEAIKAGLDGISATATVDKQTTKIKIKLSLNNLILPENTYLEGFLVDAGINGGPGRASNSNSDEKYGVFLNNASYKRNQDLAPFVQPLGRLSKDGDFYTLSFSSPGSNFNAYDSLVVTLESFDIASAEFDPRPSAVILSTQI